MAATHFSRSRSPVISIRTQPEEQDNLRAEIEAANRTQHEILPRYSWHSTFMKRDTQNTLRKSYPPVVQREDCSAGQLPQSHEASLYRRPDELTLPFSIINKQSSTLPKQGLDRRKPWRQFTRRAAKSKTHETAHRVPTQPISANIEGRGRQKISRSTKLADEIVTDQDLAVQDAQFNAWLEERLEEQNTVGDLHQTLPSKAKRTIRRSVYGSLSSTKNFFRPHQKSAIGKFYNRAGLTLPIVPHPYDFETKEQLREYLNSTSALSPLSPIETTHQTASSKEAEPAELSAGPVPAELECNSLSAPAPVSASLSRTSTPSIRDLPPYIDDKNFRTDIAKEPDNNTVNHQSTASEEPEKTLEGPYLCTSCHNIIPSHEVYDFCAICDSRDRVLCTRCAARGPCCRHELEGLLRNCALNQTDSATPQFREGSRRTRLANSVDQVGSWGNYGTYSNAKSKQQQGQRAATSTLPLWTSSTPGNCSKHTISNENLESEAGLKDAQIHLLKEMGYVRREQELVDRERELAFRSREIDLKDQQTSIREREMIVQQKSDILMRNLENLLSYQELAKSAFIGAQFHSQQATDPKGHYPQEVRKSTDDAAHFDPIALYRVEEQQQPHADIAQVVSDAEASIKGLFSGDSHTKSYAAHKRKKETASESVSSAPTSVSSPEQSRKPLSRGNSERDGSHDEDEEDDSRRSPKKHKHEPLTPNGPQLLFACPYTKNNPVRFSSRNTAEKNYRNCGTHYLPDVSRLKQHLRRVHWQPETYCPRCYEEFGNSSKLAEHAGALVACKARECPFPEKMDKTQQEKIHVKRPRVPAETVWYDIYKVLFPDQPLPDSPYMEADDRVITPLSATPQSDVNLQATQMLSHSFRQRLNQFEELQHGRLRNAVEQALDGAFKDLLSAYTLSPNASPGAGPSIVVSPVSRSSSDTTRMLHSPTVDPTRPSKLERQRSVTDVVSLPQQVPVLQHPRPPRPRVNTALQVPTDHHRSPLGLTGRESQTSGSPVDRLLNFNVLPHIQDDVGYGDDCDSFELGDDRQAMVFVDEPAQVSTRKNNSVMSNDSGYGSLRNRHNSTPQMPGAGPVLQGMWDGFDNHQATLGTNSRQLHEVQIQPSEPGTDTTSNVVDYLAESHMDSDTRGFGSYADLLGPSFRDDIYGGEQYPFFDSQYPWKPT